ncbi:Suppressor protein stp22 of temperature-sensitive alpha-factor receptor and arginine permease [Tilletia horrida]|nr:Suppressor protein stp22 of temperature-sensitive alpha-factor receptor and arginine permease [Tilletia horrida]
MDHAVVQRWLRQVLAGPYAANADRVFADVDRVLLAFSSLSPRTEVYTHDDGRSQLLLELAGTVPIDYKRATYHIPVSFWIPHGYPREAPIVYVTPTQTMLVRKGKHVDPNGRVSVAYLDTWARKPEACNLLDLVHACRDIFSQQPPVYAKPATTPAGPAATAGSSAQPAPQSPQQRHHPLQPQPPPAPLPANAGPAAGMPGPSGYSSPRSAHAAHAISSPVLSHNAAPARYQQPGPPLPPARPASSDYGNPLPAQYSPSPPPPPPLPHPAQQQSGPYAQPSGSHAPPPQNYQQAPYGSRQNTYGSGPGSPMAPTQYAVTPAPPPSGAIATPPPPPAKPLPGPSSHHFDGAPGGSLLDDDDVLSNAIAAPHPRGSRPPPPPSATGPVPTGAGGPAPSTTAAAAAAAAPPPPRPLNPELLNLHRNLHTRLSGTLHALSSALSSSNAQLEILVADLERGGEAINDERARLEAVRDVCRVRAERVGAVVEAARGARAEVEAKEAVEREAVDGLLTLVAEDHALEDALYQLGRALNAERIDLDRFLKQTRHLAREQFMRRALARKICEGMGWPTE